MKKYYIKPNTESAAINMARALCALDGSGSAFQGDPKPAPKRNTPAF
jgi:hypothetical protein